VNRLVETLAAELMDFNVQVNRIMPSVMDTPANCVDISGADHESGQDVAGRVGHPMAVLGGNECHHRRRSSRVRSVVNGKSFGFGEVGRTAKFKGP